MVALILQKHKKICKRLFTCHHIGAIVVFVRRC
nr:MAG TPA: hypothetical protein [Caudoviricetes sp.]